MHTTPAINRAIRHIKSIILSINQKDASTKAILPPVRALAKDAGVSLVTMVKAIAVVCSQGLLIVVHGKRTRIAVHGNAATATANKNGTEFPGKLWLLVKDRIESDIHTGRYSSQSTVPSLKEMAVMYGVNYRTIKKALFKLREQHILVAHGRNYRLAQTLPNKAHREILVFVNSHTNDLFLYQHDLSLLRQLETHCRRAGLSIAFIRYCQNGKTVQYINHQTGALWQTDTTPDVLGCIWIVIQESQILTECCRALLETKKPVAVLDFNGELRYPSFFYGNGQVRFFSDRDLSRPTRIVGSYLLQRGHRRIAFISERIHEPWSQGRLEGLQQVFAQAGYPDGVLSITAEAKRSGWQNDGERSYRQFVRQAMPKLSGISPKTLQKNSKHIINHLSQSCQRTIINAFYVWWRKCDLERLFLRAIKNQRITAWVFDNDEGAILGLDFLKRNKIEVPGRISVIGSSNSLEALKNGLTSYYHDTEAMLPLVLEYIVWPNRFNKLHKDKVMLFDGVVTERKTTALKRGPASERA